MTTNKCYTAFISMILQLLIYCKTTLLSQNKNITELLHNKLQATKYKEGHLFLSQS